MPAAAVGVIAGARQIVEAVGRQAQHALGEVLAQVGQQGSGATLVEVTIDAELPRRIGHQLGRLVDEAKRTNLGGTAIAHVLPQRERAHRMADEASAMQLQRVDHVVEIARHACRRRAVAGQRRVAAMGAGVPAEHPMVLRQFVDERRPFQVAGGPAVQEDDGGTLLAVAPDMQRFAIVGSEGQGKHDRYGWLVGGRMVARFQRGNTTSGSLRGVGAVLHDPARQRLDMVGNFDEKHGECPSCERTGEADQPFIRVPARLFAQFYLR